MLRSYVSGQLLRPQQRVHVNAVDVGHVAADLLGQGFDAALVVLLAGDRQRQIGRIRSLISILLGLAVKSKKYFILRGLALITYVISILVIIIQLPTESKVVFGGMM